MNKKTKIALIIVVILVVAGILSLFVFKDKHNMSAYSEKMTIAIEKNDIQQVKEILKEEPRCVNSLPTTAPAWLHIIMELPEVGYPLQTACLWGRYEIVEILLENGADCNLTWSGGIWSSKSTLICAVVSDTENSVAIVELLLKNGADKTYIDQNGKSAYSYAVEQDATDIILLLQN